MTKLVASYFRFYYRVKYLVSRRLGYFDESSKKAPFFSENCFLLLDKIKQLVKIFANCLKSNSKHLFSLKQTSFQNDQVDDKPNILF
jgi:hypothetical protein